MKKVVDLWVRKDLPPQKLESGLHALNAVMRAPEISPNVIAQGFAQSFTFLIDDAKSG